MYNYKARDNCGLGSIFRKGSGDTMDKNTSSLTVVLESQDITLEHAEQDRRHSWAVPLSM